MHIKSLFLLPLLLLPATGANAAPDRYVLDKDHTHVFFNVSHLGFSQMVGRIKSFDGYFTFDEKEPEKSEVDITLKPDSVDTDVPALNKVLLTSKFFNVDKYPVIHFRSTKIGSINYGCKESEKCASGNVSAGKVEGDLTLLGVTKPVTLQVVYNRSGIHPYTNNYVSGFSVDGDINRSDFGMDAYIPDVGDKVHIHAEVEGTDPIRHPGNIKTPH